MASNEELQQLTAEKRPEEEHDRGDQDDRNMANRSYAMSPLVTTSYICSMLFFVLVFYRTVSEEASLFSLHPICMSIGWVLLVTSAIHTISPGDALTEWIPVKNATTRHWILQLMGLTFTAIGFTAIFVNKMINQKDHFATYHGVFGLSSVVLASLTASGGLAALFGLKLKHLLAPIYLKFMHSAAGIITYSFTIITIILGLSSTWFSSNIILKNLCITLVVIVGILTVLRPTVKLVVRIRERISYLQPSN